MLRCVNFCSCNCQRTYVFWIVCLLPLAEWIKPRNNILWSKHIYWPISASVADFQLAVLINHITQTYDCFVHVIHSFAPICHIHLTELHIFTFLWLWHLEQKYRARQDQKLVSSQNFIDNRTRSNNINLVHRAWKPWERGCSSIISNSMLSPTLKDAQNLVRCSHRVWHVWSMSGERLWTKFFRLQQE